jgi:hypothetical protein
MVDGENEDEDEAIRDFKEVRQEADMIHLTMAKMISEMPNRLDRINKNLEKALRGHPRLLCMAAMADAFSAALVDLDGRERIAAMLAFQKATIEMVTIREGEGGKNG